MIHTKLWSGFVVTHWASWSPLVDTGLSRLESWQEGQYESCNIEKPALAGFPPMLRRRLGPLGKVVCQVLSGISCIDSKEAYVMSSRMGEINRTQRILECISAGEQVSPASFSLSVHNAIGGVWSQAHSVTTPVIAIAPSSYSPIPALVQALALMSQGNFDGVIVVYYEEDYPEFYAPYLQGLVAPTAFGVRLTNRPRRENGVAAANIPLLDLIEMPEMCHEARWCDLPELIRNKAPIITDSQQVVDSV